MQIRWSTEVLTVVLPVRDRNRVRTADLRKFIELYDRNKYNTHTYTTSNFINGIIIIIMRVVICML